MLNYLLCECVLLCGGWRATWESQFSPSHVGSGDQTAAIRPCGKHPCLLTIIWPQRFFFSPFFFFNFLQEVPEYMNTSFHLTTKTISIVLLWGSHISLDLGWSLALNYSTAHSEIPSIPKLKCKKIKYPSDAVHKTCL